jgi:hypothetical protein
VPSTNFGQSHSGAAQDEPPGRPPPPPVVDAGEVPALAAASHRLDGAGAVPHYLRHFRVVATGSFSARSSQLATASSRCSYSAAASTIRCAVL